MLKLQRFRVQAIRRMAFPLRMGKPFANQRLPEKDSLEYRQMAKRMGAKIKKAEETMIIEEGTMAEDELHDLKYKDLPPQAGRHVFYLTIPSCVGLLTLLASEYFSVHYATSLSIIYDSLTITLSSLGGALFGLQQFATDPLVRKKIREYLYAPVTLIGSASALWFINSLSPWAGVPFLVAVGYFFARHYGLSTQLPYAAKSLNLSFQFSIWSLIVVMVTTFSILNFISHRTKMERHLADLNRKNREEIISKTTSSIPSNSQFK